MTFFSQKCRLKADLIQSKTQIVYGLLQFMQRINRNLRVLEFYFLNMILNLNGEQFLKK